MQGKLAGECDWGDDTGICSHPRPILCTRVPRLAAPHATADISDMYTKLSASRAYVYAVARACDQGNVSRQVRAGSGMAPGWLGVHTCTSELPVTCELDKGSQAWRADAMPTGLRWRYFVLVRPGCGGRDGSAAMSRTWLGIIILCRSLVPLAPSHRGFPSLTSIREETGISTVSSHPIHPHRLCAT
jgi:hypothetical protein